MNTEQQIRKSPRLASFDYTSSRYYFVTICTHEHRQLFGMVTVTPDNGKMHLNPCGEVLKRHICELGERYPFVKVDQYVIMPNHLHMILLLDNDNHISLTRIIGAFKAGVSREIGEPIWQRSFYDHVIRGEEDYRNIWHYIENNPAQWALDKYHPQDA